MDIDEKVRKATRAAIAEIGVGGGVSSHTGLTEVGADDHHNESHSHAHSDLTGIGENDHHVPPGGGGNSPTIKSGTITTDGSGVGTVTFNTEFPDTNYAIILTCQDPGDTGVAMYYNKAVGGFNVKTEDDRGSNERDVTVDWVATPYNNP